MITTYKEIYTGIIKNGKRYHNNLNAVKNKIKSLEGCRFQMTLDLFEEIRTVQWNAYYWAVVVANLVEATGNSVDDVHDALKKKYLKEIIRVDKKTGDRIKLDSTTKLYNREFAHFCKLIRVGEADICYIPEPNEIEYF